MILARADHQSREDDTTLQHDFPFWKYQVKNCNLVMKTGSLGPPKRCYGESRHSLFIGSSLFLKKLL